MTKLRVATPRGCFERIGEIASCFAMTKHREGGFDRVFARYDKVENSLCSLSDFWANTLFMPAAKLDSLNRVIAYSVYNEST